MDREDGKISLCDVHETVFVCDNMLRKLFDVISGSSLPSSWRSPGDVQDVKTRWLKSGDENVTIFHHFFSSDGFCFFEQMIGTY